MSRNTLSKEKLRQDLADVEQRHLIVDAEIRNLIPLQIRAMREDRDWTQTEMAKKLGTTQNAISRLENPQSNLPTIPTLERIAEVFDVALLVRFAPFSGFINIIGEPSSKSVAVPSYESESRSESTAEQDALEDTAFSGAHNPEIGNLIRDENLVARIRSGIHLQPIENSAVLKSVSNSLTEINPAPVANTVSVLHDQPIGAGEFKEIGDPPPVGVTGQLGFGFDVPKRSLINIATANRERRATRHARRGRHGKIQSSRAARLVRITANG
jgi:transcriptional regulator with XRE-family HTH domain